MSDEQLRKLSRKRGSLKASLTNFSKFVASVKDKTILGDTEAIQLRDRIARIEPIFIEFNDIQCEIESLVENLDEQYTERSKFEDTFSDWTALAKCILSKQTIDDIDRRSQRSLSLHSEPGTQALVSGVKLPTIELPKFDGTYEIWLEFRDTFESLIHNNISLTSIQKFHYLRASLQGNAAQVIKSIEFTGPSYEVAWHTLCERYNNKKLLVHNHVKALYSIEPLVKESSSKIRKLVDNISKHLRSLEQLGQKTENWDTLLIFMITTKLDTLTTREWEKENNSFVDFPTWNKLKDFLKGRANLLETLEFKTNERQVVRTRDHKSSARALATASYTCYYCKNQHSIYRCSDFLKLPIANRQEFVKNAKLCENCLREGHSSKRCKIGPCKKCRQWHNTLLHIESRSLAQDETDNPSKSTTLNTTTSYPSPSQTFLSTAIVKILDKNRQIHEARVLLDCGSQTSFITSEMCKKLNLDTHDTNLSVYGISDAISTIRHKCEIEILSMHNTFKARLTCYVIPRITGFLPNITIDAKTIEIPENITLADPNFFESGPIDILIGADLFWDLLGCRKISAGKNKPMIQETKLGWIISGQLGSQSKLRSSKCNLTTCQNLHKLLSSFWEVEEFNNSKPMTDEERSCETHFQETTRRALDGRFIVSLPLKQHPESLGETRTLAESRFLSLERKLQNNQVLRERYVQFMNEYASLGHMTEVEISQAMCQDAEYFMPHHGVLKEESTTTKLRVVFDASAPSSNGLSLNNIEMVGATIQDDLLAIILRFRKFKYVISADIAKMYRQVLVEPSQRSLQKIIWRSTSSEPLRHYVLNTVTYGHASASFLAIRCLVELANECENDLPEIARVIRQGFYVDDMLTGADTISRASIIAQEVSRVLQAGGFELRKWHSNEPKILERIDAQTLDNTILEFSPDQHTKTLGLTWCCQTDKLLYNIKVDSNVRCTKRSVLSLIAKIFDPLGLLGPCTIRAKIIMQRLWSAKVGWDDQLPNDILIQWQIFKSSLGILNNLEIGRHVLCDNVVRVEMHGFADASEAAYGACIYLRSMDESGNVLIKLLASKTKVAPIKSLTIPKLELCGALLLARLIDKVLKSIEIKFNHCVLWSDSTVTLAWIKTSPNLLKTFIANRVSEIQTLTNNCEWRYVPSQDNPADILSRGLNPNQMLQATVWWHGPPWLQADPISWPIQRQRVSEVPELKPQAVLTVQCSDNFPFERFSNFTRLKRVTAYILRFLSNCKKQRDKRELGPLTQQELDRALKNLVKSAQRESFSDELKCLTKAKIIPPRSKLLNLSPFLDSDKVIRVGGRLKYSDYPFDKKHPIVLDGKHRMTRLLFESEHQRLLHAGPQLLLFSIRDQFWPISGRNLAKDVTRKCVRCFRFNPVSIQPIMGNLPRERAMPSSPFTITGVDYAGPFLIRDRKGRGSRSSKAYVSTFICFSTKAIHLELVSSLSSEAFIMALRRFIARRGKPSKIYSDNGTNFVGANRELKRCLESNKVELFEVCGKEEIEWHFLPPYSPHFGGLWEAGVKSFKYHLKRVIGHTALLFEELTTILAQIEAILNSRPLCPLSSDPNDFHPLSPAHFLIGRSLVGAPDVNLSEEKINRLTRFQLVQQACQHFWKRWSQEYVSELQQRVRWKQTRGDIAEGTLVLIKDDAAMPSDWKMGRIVQLHPGPDGHVRVVSIRTRSGVHKRNFSKICPLPVEV